MRQLVDYLGSPEAQERVLNRVLTLARQSPDLRYENSADTPLSVYLLALGVHDAALARVAAQAIAETKQCWWARRIAEDILLGRNVRTSSRDDTADITFGETHRVTLVQADATGESVIITGLATPGARMQLWSKSIRTDNQLAHAA